MWKKGTRVSLIACGSFNPPTIMHMRMLEAAKDVLEHERGCIVVEGIMSPVGDQYAKPSLVCAAHRLAMLERVTSKSSWIRLDAWECEQKQWQRTLVVLHHHQKRVHEQYGDDVRVVLVVGGDVVQSFSRILPSGEALWNPLDIKDIITKFGLIILARDGSDPMELLKSLPDINGVAEYAIIISDDVCPCSMSSTRVRDAVRKGRSIKYAIPDGVISYISENKLYL